MTAWSGAVCRTLAVVPSRAVGISAHLELGRAALPAAPNSLPQVPEAQGAIVNQDCVKKKNRKLKTFLCYTFACIHFADFTNHTESRLCRKLF